MTEATTAAAATTTAATTTAATTTAAATTTTTAAPWYEGKADPELVGYMQSKGWDKDAPTGAIEAAKAHREIQKMIGVPADKLLRMPEASAEPAVLDAFWQRLGAAKEAKDIDLSGVKSASGAALDDKLAEVIRSTAIAGRIPKDSAVAIAAALQKHFDAQTAQSKTIHDGTIQTEKEALLKSWGPNREANEFVAKNALGKLAAAANLPPEKAQQAWDALSKVGGIGAAAAMEMLRVVGAKMGEDKYVNGGVGGGNMPMTREAAMAEITALKGDALFRDKLLNGGVEENKQWTALHKIAFAQQAA